MRIDTFSDRMLYKISSKDIEKDIDRRCVRNSQVVSKNDELKLKDGLGYLEDVFKEFARIFKNSFTEQQTKSMYYRLNRLLTEEQNETLKKNQKELRLGSYNAFYNRMTLHNYEDESIPDKKQIIFHELLHMASSRTTNDGNISGFDIVNSIGETLNEGYTEYLRLKYFTNEDYTESDDWRITVVKGIENIVGEQQMQKFYFSADLQGLINELQKYSSKENVIKLLFLMDRVDTKTFSEKRYKQVINEIARINQNKLDYYLDKGTITPMQYDMMRALKVEEYKNSTIWGENSKFSMDGTSFVITDGKYVSPLYELSTKTKKNIQKM